MIGAYLAERFPLTLFLPLAVVIAAAATGARADGATLALDTLVALLLLAEFRIWDDLADRPADALAHPGRVLVTARSSAPFVALCAALAVVNAAIAVTRDGFGLSVLALVLLHAVLGAWYIVRGQRSVAGDQLLLAKYPAFVLVLAGARLIHAPLIVLGSALAIYAAASFHEAWHDPRRPHPRLGEHR